MDEILLYLSLKYFGDWMAIYDSLQKKEELKVYEIKKAVNEVDADWITLISSDYPANLKTIYKPPFGVFCYGLQKLLNSNIITIYGSMDESNSKYLEQLRKNNITMLWPKKTNKQILEILSKMPINNIFYLEELNKANDRTFENILSDEKVIMNNAFCSEIWQKQEGIDYSNQWQERLYLGLSLQALIISPLKNKEMLSLVEYAKKENIKVGILKDAYSQKIAKAFDNRNLYVIDNEQQILDYFQNSK